MCAKLKFHRIIVFRLIFWKIQFRGSNRFAVFDTPVSCKFSLLLAKEGMGTVCIMYIWTILLNLILKWKWSITYSEKNHQSTH